MKISQGTITARRCVHMDHGPIGNKRRYSTWYQSKRDVRISSHHPKSGDGNQGFLIFLRLKEMRRHLDFPHGVS